MERVQFQQEQMLAELKDLVQKGLFTTKETKEIMKKRTTFETALVRRVAKKADYLRYAAYEMGLEQLRRKRVERLKLPPSPPSVSDYALVRRQFQIFERALKRFKADIGLWLEYIEVARREGARALVGRISARALQLHPNEPALYILSASQEMKNHSPATARTLLQRGLRLNSDSVDLWKEYVKMELGFIESLRRRWEVLGIDNDKGKEKQKDAMNVDDDTSEVEEIIPVGDADGEGDDESAQKEIMDGAIVKSVISSAVKAIPKLPLFNALLELVSSYPSPPVLRASLTTHIYAMIRETLPDDAEAIRLVACRELTADNRQTNLKGSTTLIERLGNANVELMDAVRHRQDEKMNKVYAHFVEEWCRKLNDESLIEYLIGSLERVIREKDEPSPSLLSTHIKLLIWRCSSRENSTEKEKAKVLRVSRKYGAGLGGESAAVCLAWLDAEKMFGTKETMSEAWRVSRKRVKGPNVESVWRWSMEEVNDGGGQSVGAQ